VNNQKELKMIIEKLTNHRYVIFFIFCVVCMISPRVQSEDCETETSLTFLVDKVGLAIREAQRSESADQKPRMNIVSVSISVAQQVQESDTGKLFLKIPVFSSVGAAAAFSKSEEIKIVQTLKFKVDKVSVSGGNLSTNLIKAIESSKKAMRHAVNASKNLKPDKMKFTQAFAVICNSSAEVSIVLAGYKGVEVLGNSNSITFEIEVDE